MSRPGDGPVRLTRDRQQLVERISGTVVAIALSLAAQVGDTWFEDLRASGYLAATEAATRYTLGSPTSFEGFAWTRIAGAMIDFLRKERVKLPPALAAALEEAAAAVEVATDYAAEVTDKGDDTLHEEADGLAAVLSVGLLCLGAGTQNPETLLLREERRAHVRRALSLLPERDRELVNLRYFEAQKLHEIAHHFQIHEETARKRHKDAMRRLGAMLRPILLGDGWKEMGKKR